MALKVKHIQINQVKTDICDPTPEETTYSLTNGSALKTGDDLFQIKTIGNYFSSTSAITNSLKNCPITDEPFRLVCGYLLEDSDFYLILRSGSGEIYTTVSVSDSYSYWKPVHNGLNTASSITGINFSYDFQSVSTTDLYANVNRRSFFSITDSNRNTWLNIPSTMPTSGTVKGYREVLWMDSKNLMVKDRKSVV